MKKFFATLFLIAITGTAFAQHTPPAPPRPPHPSNLPTPPTPPKPKTPGQVFRDITGHHADNAPNQHKYVKSNNGKHKGWYKKKSKAKKYKY